MAEWVKLFAPEHFRVGVNFWVSSYRETTKIAGQMFVQKSTGIETMLGLTLHLHWNRVSWKKQVISQHKDIEHEFLQYTETNPLERVISPRKQSTN